MSHPSFTQRDACIHLTKDHRSRNASIFHSHSFYSRSLLSSYRNRATTERDKARFARERVLCPTSDALFVRLSISSRDEILRALVRRIGDKHKSLLPKSLQCSWKNCARLIFNPNDDTVNIGISN